METENKYEKRMNALQLIADQVNNAYTPEQIGIVQNNIAKGTSETELAYFLNVCKTMNLNPFNKEVWCYKDKKNNLLIFAGRDGFLSKAQQNPLFNGIRSIEIRENDEFDIDVINDKITHKITQSQKERGNILYGVAVVFRKDGESTIEIAEFQTYNKGFNTWKTHPAEMIKKVAEAHALKKAFGISGIQSEYDFKEKDGVVEPISTEKEKELTNDEIQNRLNKCEETGQIFELWLELSEEQQSEYNQLFEQRKTELDEL